MNREEFFFQIYEIVKQIPYGKVTTYGQLALLAGHPSRARQAGQAMARAPHFLGLPCHRVVNSRGQTAPGWPQQRALLEEEGIFFTPGGFVDLKRHWWRP